MNNRLAQNIIVAGVSFKTTELLSRSRFAFNAEACGDTYNDTLLDVPFFILSTCNRTEIYGWTADVNSLTEILRAQAECPAEELEEIIYIKKGSDAVNHFFRVAAGLESQIIGDYEIISQIKTAFNGAKDHRRTNGILEKMYNFALQASKDVKNNTSFSDGTLSVPFAAVKKLIGRNDIHTVTIVGAGETGELVIKYVRGYLPHCNVRLVNRDEEKLHNLGSKYDVVQFPIAALSQSLIDADALIVATNASIPIVDREHISESIRIVIDLSVPRNVGQRVYKMKTLDVFDVDVISESIHSTKTSRLSEIPRVEEILARHVESFDDWIRRHEAYSV
jgi:glutamyl-tRNA reductase